MKKLKKDKSQKKKTDLVQVAGLCWPRWQVR